MFTIMSEPGGPQVKPPEPIQTKTVEGSAQSDTGCFPVEKKGLQWLLLGGRAYPSLTPGREEKLLQIAPGWYRNSRAGLGYDSPPKGEVQSATQHGAPARLKPGIIIVRHGQSEHNIANAYNSSPKNEGYVESNLTEKGIAQVLTTTNLLAEQGLSDANIRAVYVSTLPRAQQTADVWREELHISEDKIRLNSSIVDIDKGKYDGKPEQGLFDKLHGKNNHKDGREYGGENKTDVEARVTQFLEQILRECDKNSNVVVITHGTPSDLMLEYLLGAEQKKLETGGFMSISWDDIYRHREEVARARKVP